MKCTILGLTFALLLLLGVCPADMETLNHTRGQRGLYPLIEDPKLTELAEKRLQYNLKRRHWGHPGGKLCPARGEGVGYSYSENRWHTCFMHTRMHRYAGCARAKVGRQYWMLLLVR